jgi:hypothetical protein
MRRIQPFYARDVGNGEIPGVQRLVKGDLVPGQDITVLLPERQSFPLDPAWERRVDLYKVLDHVQVRWLMLRHPSVLGETDDGDEGLHTVRARDLPRAGSDDLVKIVGALPYAPGALSGELKLHPEPLWVLHRHVETVVPACAVSPEAGHLKDFVSLRPEFRECGLHGVTVALLWKHDRKSDSIVGLFEELGGSDCRRRPALLELSRQ